MRAIRLIGYSPTAGFVLTVIIDAVDAAGITAWKTRGTDLRDYLEGLFGQKESQQSLP